MHRLTPGIMRVQTIQRPTRGAPSGHIAEHHTRGAGTMLQTGLLRQKRWLLNTAQRGHRGPHGAPLSGPSP